jgi:hypothetical protein
MSKGNPRHGGARPTTTHTIRQMRSDEAAWVGAMIEAEGSVSVYRPVHGTNDAIQIQVSNTDVEIISTLLRFVGAGNVRYVRPGVGQRWVSKKGLWIWSLSQQIQLRALAPQIAPWMTAKGERLLAALN